MTELTCVVVDGDGTHSGAQGFDYFEGISAESSGARGLCMHRLEIPPGGAARPHSTSTTRRGGPAPLMPGTAHRAP